MGHTDFLEFVIRSVRYFAKNLQICLTFSFTNNINLSICVSVSRSMLDKPVVRSVTLVGNCTVWNMESSLMVRCPAIRRSEAVMIHLIPSSAKPVPGNTSLEPCSWIWNLQLLTKYELGHTVNFSILNNSSLVKKMQLTTMLVDITPLVKNSLTKC